jgi:anti-anti-sigma factor
MSLEVQSRHQETNLILDLDGFITLGAGSVTLRNEMHKALASDAPVIILNCERVDFVDSSGLAELVSAHIHLEKLGRKLVLKNLDWRLHSLLDATRLSTVLHIETAPQPASAPAQ